MFCLIQVSQSSLRIAGLALVLGLTLQTNLGSAGAAGPQERMLLKQLRMQEGAVGITLAGSTLYLSLGFDGFVAFTLTELPIPMMNSTWRPDQGFVQSVSVMGTTVYASVPGACHEPGDGLVVLDVSNPLQPQKVSAFSPPLKLQNEIETCQPRTIPAYQAVLDGSMLYLATLGLGVYGLDVSDPRQPKLRFHVPEIGRAWGLAYDAGFLYVAAGRNGLLVLDVRNPDEPVMRKVYQTKGDALSLIRSEAQLYLIDDDYGLIILDVNDPFTQKVRGVAPGRGLSTFNMVERDGLLFLADYLEGLLIMDVRSPGQPALVSALQDVHPWDLVLTASHVYLADDRRGLVTVDVSDPRRPNILN